MKTATLWTASKISKNTNPDAVKLHVNFACGYTYINNVNRWKTVESGRKTSVTIC